MKNEDAEEQKTPRQESQGDQDGDRGEVTPGGNALLTSISNTLVGWWRVLDAHLADVFGLNQSRYQWALDEYLLQKEREKEALEVKQSKQQAQLREMEEGKQSEA